MTSIKNYEISVKISSSVKNFAKNRQYSTLPTDIFGQKWPSEVNFCKNNFR